MVGKNLVNELIADQNCEKINVIVRRQSNFLHPKIQQHIINFENEEDYVNRIKGDVLFSCLGTTRAQAGSPDNNYLVDYTYQLRAAKAASQNGIPHYQLISSPFADISSDNYYRKMKAQLEEAIIELDFKKIVIIKPNGILGKRAGKRNWENIAGRIFTPLIKLIPPLRKYTPIQAIDIAKSMLNTYFNSTDTKQRITVLLRVKNNIELQLDIKLGV